MTAALVEPDSAHVLESVSALDAVAVAGRAATPSDPGTPSGSAVTTLAAGASDVIQVIDLMAAGLGDPDDLEDVIITWGRCHHLITPLPAAGADGLIMVVTLDRVRTNLALARRQLRALGPLLEAATAPGDVS